MIPLGHPTDCWLTVVQHFNISSHSIFRNDTSLQRCIFSSAMKIKARVTEIQVEQEMNAVVSICKV